MSLAAHALAAPLAVGAEAEIRAATFLGRAVVEKRRLAKGYRHPMLDADLRASRTRDEASLLMAARRAGVPVPAVYDVDRGAATLRLEPIAGRTLREVLSGPGDGGGPARMRTLGAIVARLHDAGLTHGDLTTGNVLVPDADPHGLVLIDFGLGLASAEPEPRGVDLHLLEEALEATRADAAELFAAFLGAYRSHAAGAAKAIQRLEDIRTRGRNR